MLYHISEDPSIAQFVPRPAPNAPQRGEMVWAIDNQHLRNYLLPRNCPRVCFAIGKGTSRMDWERLACGSLAHAVIAVESGWLTTIRSTTLYQYSLPEVSFERIDDAAGYYIAREPITPLGVTAIPDLIAALLDRDVELRIMPSLWPLYDAVVASTLEFSIIRMRHAIARS